MAKKLYFTVLALIVFTAGAFCGPVLEITDKDFDFGVIPQDAEVSHHFWFKSTGDDTLVINEIKTGCSCLLMPIEKKVLAPGDSTLVGILWDVGKRMNATGVFPYIFTNASPDPYRLILSGRVLQTLQDYIPISFKPFRFNLTIFDKKSINEIKFTVKNSSDSDINIKLLSILPKECELKIPEKVKAKSEQSGYIKVKPEFIDKEFKSSITILCDDPKETRMTIPILRKIY